MSKTIEVKCKNCGTPFIARTADRKRGWGKFCSKSCKAIKQEKRTGQCAAYHARQGLYEDGEEFRFCDAHLFSNEEHDCNKDF